MSHVKLDNISVKFPIYKTRAATSLFSKMIGSGGSKRDFFAIKSLSLSFQQGDRIGLLGKNGSGKSTLLKVMGGILPPTEGGIDIDGKIFPALTAAPGIQARATCLQNIILQGLSFGLKGVELREYIDEVSEFSDLGDFLNSPHNTLSAGMKGRFAVATLNYVKPQLLFMDEWIGAADKVVLEKNKGLLSKLVSQSEIFVIASHRRDIIEAHCNKALVMNDGEPVFLGSVETAFAELAKCK